MSNLQSPPSSPRETDDYKDCLCPEANKERHKELVSRLREAFPNLDDWIYEMCTTAYLTGVLKDEDAEEPTEKETKDIIEKKDAATQS